jgi:hypothetical protein
MNKNLLEKVNVIRAAILTNIRSYHNEQVLPLKHYQNFGIRTLLYWTYPGDREDFINQLRQLEREHHESIY